MKKSFLLYNFVNFWNFWKIPGLPFLKSWDESKPGLKTSTGQTHEKLVFYFGIPSAAFSSCRHWKVNKKCFDLILSIIHGYMQLFSRSAEWKQNKRLAASISWKNTCTSYGRVTRLAISKFLHLYGILQPAVQPGWNLLLNNLNIVDLKYCGTPYRPYTFWTAEALSSRKSA